MASMLDDWAPPQSGRAADPDLEDFFENGAIGLHLVDRRGVILRANKAELQMLGYTAEEYVGRRIADIHADAEVIADILRRLASGQKLDRYPARLKAKDGSIRHVLISSSVRFENGEFLNTRCFSIDVTASQEAEAARIEAERRLETTYNSAIVGLTEADADGRLLRVNAAFGRITGYAAEELLGASFAELTHPEDRAQDAALYGAQVRGELDSYTIEKRYRRKDGETVFVEVQSSSVKGPDGRFRYGVRVVKDVTDRKRAELELQSAERRWRELLNALPMAVYTTDAEGRVTFFNEAAAAFSGRRPQLGEKWCVTWKLYTADGEPLPHEQCPMAIAIRERRPVRGVEAIAERPDGGRTPFIPFPTPMFDADGRLTGAINMLVDISSRKAAEAAIRSANEALEERVRERTRELQDALTEKEAAEARLRQSQKMEAVGQLTGGVAHDFNNLLAAIIPSLEMAKARISDDRALKLIETAEHAAARGASLTHQLLAFSRKQHLAPRPIQLKALVEQMCEMLPRTLGPAVAIETELDAALWPGLADPSQLELAILNLAINARDAMPEGGTLRIRTRNLERGLAVANGLGGGRYVRLSITDTGIGMSEEVRARAFEPFFSTKTDGRGSGLGLSMVYGFAQQSGGQMSIDSRKGQGTTIHIDLPAAEAEPASNSLRSGEDSPDAGPPARILIVDDDPAVRRTTAELVRELGHTVMEADSGEAALARLEAGDSFELMVVDLAMPRMNGAVFAQQARRFAPATPILFVTGYADLEWTSKAPADGLLKKPFTRAQIAEKLRTLLRPATRDEPGGPWPTPPSQSQLST